MDSWTRFYTPKVLAKDLIKQIGDLIEPSNVIDICAGSCNLLREARELWPKTKIYASDIEEIKLESHISGNFYPSQMDALNIKDLRKRFKRKRNKLILANPPFGDHNILATHIPKNMLHFNDSCKGINRIECQILIANFSIMNKGDVFAGVLPENLFTGEKMSGFRKNMFELFDNLKITSHSIKFDRSEVKTRLISGIFNPSKTTNGVSIKVPENIENIELIRGIDNSKLLNFSCSNNNIEVLHFNNIEGIIRDRKMVINNDKNRLKQIESDDILIFRVGRNAGKVFIPEKKHIGMAPSDLLLILRDGKRFSKKRMNKFEENLIRRKKGLTSSYITKRDILLALN